MLCKLVVLHVDFVEREVSVELVESSSRFSSKPKESTKSEAPLTFLFLGHLEHKPSSFWHDRRQRPWPGGVQREATQCFHHLIQGQHLVVGEVSTFGGAPEFGAELGNAQTTGDVTVCV